MPRREGGGVVLHPGVLPFLGVRPGKASSSSWGGDEGDVPAQLGSTHSWGKTDWRVFWVSAMGVHDGLDGGLQVLHVPVPGGDDLFPSPTGPRRWSGGCPGISSRRMAFISVTSPSPRGSGSGRGPSASHLAREWTTWASRPAAGMSKRRGAPPR